jgi:chorismate-pyruvate lyase
LRGLFALFGAADEVPEHEFVPGPQVPPPYHDLLVHEHHMTVTVESFYGSLVDVRILDRRQSGDDYARKILLALQSDERVVQFGIVRIILHHCSSAVQAAIVAGQTPLGRILIEHDVLRRIEPTAYLRVTPNPAMMEWFSLAEPTPTYGRLAYIHCNEQPAVELVEIVAPVSEASQRRR